MAWHADAGVGQGEPDALEKRIGDEKAQQDGGGKQQGGSEPAFVLQPLGLTAGPSGYRQCH